MSILSESCQHYRLQRCGCSADIHYRTGKNHPQTDLRKLCETSAADGYSHQTSAKYCSDAVHRRIITLPQQRVTRTILHSIIAWVLLCTVACSQQKCDIAGGEDGEGTVSVSGGPVTVSHPATLTFVFKVGASGIDIHGGILFHVSPYWNWSHPQSRSNTLPGFTQFHIKSKNPVKLEPEFGEMPFMLLRIQDGTLAAGDTITIVYGAVSDGRGAAMTDRYAESAQEFVFKTDADGDGEYREIKHQPTVSVLPGEPAQLLITGPSEVSLDESVQLRIAVLDRYGNWVQDWTGEMRLEKITELVVPDIPVHIGPGENNVIRLKSQSQGIARVSGSIADGEIRGISNPIYIGSHNPDKRLYWGDIHGHSVLSDGTGTPDDYFRYARYASACDFAALTDHDSWGFRPLNTVRDAYIAAIENNHSPGRFITFFGYEWTSWTFGHRNVYTLPPDYRIYDNRDSDFDEPEELYRALDPDLTLVIPHHLGGGPIPFDLRDSKTALIPAAEVVSVHGVSESYGALHTIYNAQASGYYRDALNMGYRWGAIASSDSHDGHPGLRTSGRQLRGMIAVRAENLGREEIFNAIKSRRTYATSGARIIVDFSVDDIEMGGVLLVERGGTPVISGSVTGEFDLERITLIRNGIAHKRFYGQGNQAVFKWKDESPVTEPTWYYLVINQMDDEIAVTSPIWCDLR